MDEEGISKDVIAKTVIETNNQTMMKSMEQLFQIARGLVRRSDP